MPVDSERTVESVSVSLATATMQGRLSGIEPARTYSVRTVCRNLSVAFRLRRMGKNEAYAGAFRTLQGMGERCAETPLHVGYTLQVRCFLALSYLQQL